MKSIINAYIGTFEKQDGEKRSMRFAKIEDLPEDFIECKTKGGQQRKLPEGKELVWDLDKSEFRVFNWKTVEGEVTQITNFPLDKVI